ncbi:hypothetical protein [Psychrobacter sp. DAB_AL43B]|jgi:hypothetical protein|uniref:hypothetical protein n=1 Tax=Psychrobacter sp. DAB_AL43B TaxID=1028416 RepID=UPI0009A83D2C|nr:hypothetical protein [Psychrobacter sp. DAB_AL43B]SLJ85948.1 hypothetical protein DABAL43B_2784 [Psychrobacter sp. DAB_AL43B]
MSTEYILEVYESDDRRANNKYISSTPFGAFSVGDTVKTETQGTARITSIGHMVSQLPKSERITHITMLYTSIRE